MTTTPDLPELPPGVTMRLLPPKSTRTRTHLPRWDVWLGSDRIGEIEAWKVDSATATFYRATGFHPHTARSIRLESNTDLRERVDKILKAWLHPDEPIFAQTW